MTIESMQALARARAEERQAREKLGRAIAEERRARELRTGELWAPSEISGRAAAADTAAIYRALYRPQQAVRPLADRSEYGQFADDVDPAPRATRSIPHVTSFHAMVFGVPGEPGVLLWGVVSVAFICAIIAVFLRLSTGVL